MHEFTAAPLAPLSSGDHLLRPLLDLAAQRPLCPIASVREGDRFVDVTAAEVADRARRLAKGLIAAGVAPGDRVALMSHTRLEWLVVDDAILMAGAITVPIYDTSSADQVAWIVSDSGAVLLVVETPAMRDMATASIPEGTVARIVTIDDGGLDGLQRDGATVDDAVVDGRIAGIGIDDLATIIYTSGTTGRPKGCMLTHRNLRTNVLQSLEAIGPAIHADDSGLLFLPLAHALTKTTALFIAERHLRDAFATDIAHLPEELQLAAPTVICAVPRIFEKVFNSARHHAHQDHKGWIFDRATEVAIEWSKERAGGHVSPWTAAAHAVFDRLVYARIRAATGGHLRFAFSGGGPLGERLTHYFAGIGLDIYEGYGLTETGPTLTVNRPGAWKPGTVGRPVAGTSIRIAPDGEILAKGPQVFLGYWHNPEATAQVFDADGWFLTGDIGELDDEGFLRITGRKKELIVTSAGKNVAPAPLEDRLRSHELISQAIVIGDAKPFIAALITLDEIAVSEWVHDHGAAHDGELDALVQAAVDDANRIVSRAESIREFRILPRDLTIEAGELTPTLKVRRAVVEQHYAEVIAGLYESVTV